MAVSIGTGNLNIGGAILTTTGGTKVAIIDNNSGSITAYKSHN